ncbi:MAG: neutral/alkaline non-lysosomal ceramidase N-terminal domain-containing protein [Polyangiales bacterium]
MTRSNGLRGAFHFAILLCFACSSSPSVDAGEADAGGDSAMGDVALPDSAIDAGIDSSVDGGPLAHCDFASLAPTALAGEPTEAGPLQAGAAEAPLEVPVGTALGAFTSRLRVLSGSDTLDDRPSGIAAPFLPSYGIETYPMVKAVALSAGGEQLVILKADLGMADATIMMDVEAALTRSRGRSFHGKVLLATSHSHGVWAQFSSNSILWLGFSVLRERVRAAIVSGLVGVAEASLDALEPARIGISRNDDFDLEDAVSRDRRPENDEIAGGPEKDHYLTVVRVDDTDGNAIAVIPVFGVHPTVVGSRSLFASTDAAGAIERSVEESFDHRVVVMHLQGAAGDVAPAGDPGITCEDGADCFDFARVERLGRLARPWILDEWAAAGEVMESEVEMEMLTTSVALGPEVENFNVGPYAYGAWDGITPGDGRVFDEAGMVLSPLDEFNAPAGAALCGDGEIDIAVGPIPGTDFEGSPYVSCAKADVAAPLISAALRVPLGPMPACGSTRTLVSALRIGGHYFATLPGEPVTLVANRIRAESPSPEQTTVIGFAQDHMGYILLADDWLQSGYEPAINVWGPLEGEVIVAEAIALLSLAQTAEREDATAGRASFPQAMEPVPFEYEPASNPSAGEIPALLPEQLYWYPQVPETPSTTSVRRLDNAHLVWIGEHPLEGTPEVRIEVEVDGTFEELRRRSGRRVYDQDLLLTHTPDPLDADAPTTHYWGVQWQVLSSSDALEDRAGLPLGRYRFHVSGPGYEVVSEPFEVEAAALQLTRDADAVVVSYLAPNGWRLLHPELPANGPIPVSGSVELTIEYSGAPNESRTVELDGGRFVFPAGASRITAVDRFGNEGSLAL